MDYKEMMLSFTPKDCQPASGMVVNLKEIMNEAMEKYAKEHNKKVEEITPKEKEEIRIGAFNWLTPLDMQIP